VSLGSGAGLVNWSKKVTSSRNSGCPFTTAQNTPSGNTYLASKIFDGRNTHFIKAGAIKMAELLSERAKKQRAPRRLSQVMVITLLRIYEVAQRVIS